MSDSHEKKPDIGDRLNAHYYERAGETAALHVAIVAIVRALPQEIREEFFSLLDALAKPHREEVLRATKQVGLKRFDATIADLSPNHR